MPTRTIRNLINSTFSDLKVERNAFQERVFPRLKRYCQPRSWSFQAIDSRWGISNEATCRWQKSYSSISAGRIRRLG